MKIILYKTLIRSVLTYASETWILTKDVERRLGLFERRLLRRIAGPIFEKEYGEGDLMESCMKY